jgi:deoxyribonuclease V
VTAWPGSEHELIERQEQLARAAPAPWRPPEGPYSLGGCFVCFPRGEPSGPGAKGDPAWAAAALARPGGRYVEAVATGAAGAAFEPGLLALREGPLLEAAVRALPETPGVLLVDATGRDHPRGAGLALHLGCVLDVPTVGVTHRPLRAEGVWPVDRRGAASPLLLGSETVGCWVRTRAGTRPLAVHAAWRTDVATAVEVVLATTREARTPEPLRRARRAARLARAGAG